MWNPKSAFVAGLAASGLVMLPQQPASPDPGSYVVRSDVNIIALHATVQDGRGAFVSDLTRGAFRIFEDGVPQEITIFSSDDIPVTVGLVVDNSGSMGKRHADVITGALTFIRESRAEDEMFVVNFNDRVELGLPEGRFFSNQPEELSTALMKGRVGGQTALYDAISLALDHLERASLMKKVLLIVSDGADNRSTHKLNEIVKRADRAGILLYTIGLFDESSDDKNPGVLKRLARDSGGLAYVPQNLATLSDICARIAKDIRNQYTIGYSSAKASLDSEYHQVKLTAVDGRGRQLRVRTRTGFYGVKAGMK